MSTTTFKSECEYVANCNLPSFSSVRIMMMPVVIGDLLSVPDGLLTVWKPALRRLFDCDFYRHGTGRDLGKVGYLTIDEKEVRAGETHRRAGLHVDGKGAWGGGGRPWASVETGMLTVSNVVGCRAWVQEFLGEPGDEGDCEHLRGQLRESTQLTLEPMKVYWASAYCVHESIRQPEKVRRQFVRLSLPSSEPWFEGYTRNPLGVLPTGPVLPRRKFMDQ